MSDESSDALSRRSRRNPRRVVLEQLRSVGRRVNTLKIRWNQHQMFMDHEAGIWRRRQVGERVEDHPQSWIDLLVQLRQIQREVEQLHRYAWDQAAELPPQQVGEVSDGEHP